MKAEVFPWRDAPAEPQLKPFDLHVWRFRIPVGDDAATRFRRWLPDDELARADRFIHPLHQIKFVAARYGLRSILARYLNCAPAAVAFAYHQHGKPFLGHQHKAGLNFNLSHSGDWAVLAVAVHTDVGIDIEKVVNKKNLQQLGDYIFDDKDKRRFYDFSPARREQGFYRLWTRKEAGLKMRGTGLADMKRPVTPKFEGFFRPAKGYVGAVVAGTDIHRIFRYHLILA